MRFAVFDEKILIEIFVLFKRFSTSHEELSSPFFRQEVFVKLSGSKWKHDKGPCSIGPNSQFGALA